MRKWLPLVAICTGTFMLLIDVTIVNVALPDMATDLQTTFGQLQWVVDIYALALAALVLEKGGLPLNPRGDWYTKDTIAQQLTMRSFMEELRGSGVDTGGPAAFSHADRQNFANALDRELARSRTQTGPR